MTGIIQTLVDSTTVENVAANALAIVSPITQPICTEHYAGGMPDHEIECLYQTLDRVTWADNPRTARLLALGLRKKSQKVVEAVAEVALEVVRKRCETTLQESANLIYHLVVLWHECGIKPEEVWAEMRLRADETGIAEKLPKKPGRSVARP